ncbi:ADP-ribosylglycohydrolase family protein [Streptomyces sp. NPDC060333]|uniref:ADP-ribosylglycohydrolase family protein n=1 Tax=Streptomyces sp. NPDC060333 TaxID=3347098 RepID=UPI003664349D
MDTMTTATAAGTGTAGTNGVATSVATSVEVEEPAPTTPTAATTDAPATQEAREAREARTQTPQAQAQLPDQVPANVRPALWGRVEQQDFRSRVRGTLLGAAIGDALGAPVAGLSLDGIREAYGLAGLTELAPAHGRRGTVTASTQLTLFTVDGLIRAHVRRDTGGWHPPTDVHRAYLRWAATQHDWGPDERRKDNGWLAQEEWLYARRGPDRACMTGFADETLGTLEQPKNPTARDAAATVRSAPFGLLVGWEPALVLQLAVECATQSHGHPTAFLSAGALAVIVHGLTRGESLDAAIQRALGLLVARAQHQPVTDALRRAVSAAAQGEPNPKVVESLSPGDGRDAEDALAVAVYCALVAEDVPHGLRLAVNHGGDSTATGALCGALLGALHGETALPAAWLADLEGRSTMLELSDDFALEMTQGPALHGPSVSAPGWLARYPRG